RWRSDQRFYAVVPILFVGRGLQRIAFEVLIGAGPAVGLDHFERIGRRHEDFGEQSVWIERNRCDDLIELVCAEQLLGRRWSRGLLLLILRERDKRRPKQ